MQTDPIAFEFDARKWPAPFSFQYFQSIQVLLFGMRPIIIFIHSLTW